MKLIESSEIQTPESQIAAETIIKVINHEIMRRVSVHQHAFDTLWRNPQGATPEAILQQLDTKAALVFQCSRENLDHIDRCAKIVGKTRADFLTDAECTPLRELIFHLDGTVTLKP